MVTFPLSVKLLKNRCFLNVLSNHWRFRFDLQVASFQLTWYATPRQLLFGCTHVYTFGNHVRSWTESQYDRMPGIMQTCDTQCSKFLHDNTSCSGPAVGQYKCHWDSRSSNIAVGVKMAAGHEPLCLYKLMCKLPAINVKSGIKRYWSINARATEVH